MPKESVSVLIPIYNEAENIEETLRRLIKTLDGAKIIYEVLVIDDGSEDRTADLAQTLLRDKGRVIRRSGKRSLSLSVIDGIRESAGAIIVVMDADGSHPPELIPRFAQELWSGNDLVVASRYVKGGATQGFPLSRSIVSRLGCLMGRIVTGVKDNTSGFFGIKKDALTQVKLTPQGFKIGLEIFVKADIDSYKEIPYTFVSRKRGKSKLGLRQFFQYASQVFSLLIYKIFKKPK